MYFYLFIFAQLILASQKLINQLNALYEAYSLKISLVFLNTPDSENIPVEQFYQYSFPYSLQFDKLDGYLQSPAIIFDNLSTNTLYTASMDLPNTWMIQANFSNCDMDNLFLKVTKHGCFASYQLKHILIEGIKYLIV